MATGEGAGWGLHGKVEARENIRNTVEDHLKVIAAMDRLERIWRDRALTAACFEIGTTLIKIPVRRVFRER